MQVSCHAFSSANFRGSYNEYKIINLEDAISSFSWPSYNWADIDYYLFIILYCSKWTLSALMQNLSLALCVWI